MQTILTSKQSSQPSLFPMIAIPQNGFQHIVPIGDIVRIESANSVSRQQNRHSINGESNYSYVYLLSGEAILISKKIGDCEKTLARYGFFRPHQSHLVYLPYIKKIQQSDGSRLVLVTGETIPLSFRKKAELQAHDLLVKIT